MNFEHSISDAHPNTWLYAVKILISGVWLYHCILSDLKMFRCWWVEILRRPENRTVSASRVQWGWSKSCHAGSFAGFVVLVEWKGRHSWDRPSRVVVRHHPSRRGPELLWNCTEVVACSLEQCRGSFSFSSEAKRSQDGVPHWRCHLEENRVSPIHCQWKNICWVCIATEFYTW